jgi:hypothetical protein
VIDGYRQIEILQTDSGQIRETYEFTLDANGERNKVRGVVLYHILLLKLEER